MQQQPPATAASPAQQPPGPNQPQPIHITPEHILVLQNTLASLGGAPRPATGQSAPAPGGNAPAPSAATPVGAASAAPLFYGTALPAGQQAGALPGQQQTAPPGAVQPPAQGTGVAPTGTVPPTNDVAVANAMAIVAAHNAAAAKAAVDNSKIPATELGQLNALEAILSAAPKDSYSGAEFHDLTRQILSSLEMTREATNATAKAMAEKARVEEELARMRQKDREIKQVGYGETLRDIRTAILARDPNISHELQAKIEGQLNYLYANPSTPFGDIATYAPDVRGFFAREALQSQLPGNKSNVPPPPVAAPAQANGGYSSIVTGGVGSAEYALSLVNQINAQYQQNQLALTNNKASLPIITQEHLTAILAAAQRSGGQAPPTGPPAPTPLFPPMGAPQQYQQQQSYGYSQNAQMSAQDLFNASQQNLNHQEPLQLSQLPGGNPLKRPLPVIQDPSKDPRAHAMLMGKIKKLKGEKVGAAMEGGGYAQQQQQQSETNVFGGAPGSNMATYNDMYAQ